MKKMIVTVSLFSSIVALCGYLMAQPAPPKTRPGSVVPIGIASRIFEDTSGNMEFSDGASDGVLSLKQINSNGYDISTTTISGLVGCGYERFYLGGTVSAKVGSALVAIAPVSYKNSAVAVSGATNDLTTFVGISLVASSTGSVIPVATSGFVMALTTGTVNPASIVVSTVAAAGYLSTNANSVYGADIGIALSTGNVNGGLTLIKLRK